MCIGGVLGQDKESLERKHFCKKKKCYRENKRRTFRETSRSTLKLLYEMEVQVQNTDVAYFLIYLCI